MDDVQDDVQIVKKRKSYGQWTQEESNALLEIMVDAANRGWRDNSGVFTKQIVEDRILPALNAKLGCRWIAYSTLLKFNSGFGYDSISKKFTAPNEVWDDYLKAHPKDKSLRDGVCDDYEDLQIVVGGGVAIGKNSIGLGNATDARTLQASEMQDTCIDLTLQV
ncbi:hypothetical protein ACET3Z_017640 [Daucus carota]